MKTTKRIISAAFLAALLAGPLLTFSARADDQKPVPDKMTTCPVSGDKLGDDMGPPYVFTYKGQEVKLCCKHCKKDFDKDPDKYIKKIRAADNAKN
jgi:YHS domain-containing protein